MSEDTPAKQREPYDQDGIVDRLGLLRAGPLKFALYHILNPLTGDQSVEVHYTVDDAIGGIFPADAMPLLVKVLARATAMTRRTEPGNESWRDGLFTATIAAMDRFEKDDVTRVVKVVLYVAGVPIAIVGPQELKLAIRMFDDHTTNATLVEA